MGDNWSDSSERDDPKWLLVILAGSVALAWVLKWVADTTSGPDHGGQYDLPVVNTVSWFGFTVSATLAFMTLVAAAIRIPQAARLHRQH